MNKRQTFLGVESRYETSAFVVIPCPHEKTTSYGKGTRAAPSAILAASRFLETFDEELFADTSNNGGIYTMPPVIHKNLKAQTLKILKDKKTPIILGGEHSLSIESVKAAREMYLDISVLQFDAHADLRSKYKKKKVSHATVMRRVLEFCPAVQVGIRSISNEEYVFAKQTDQTKKIHFMGNGVNIPHLNAENILSQLSNNVYITFDVDVFDSSVMPSTGTPEPGGLFWHEALDILRSVCAKKKVVGADFVELMPIKGLNAPDFTVAKLIYKIMGYITLLNS